jgi:small subunit ribosomal protein S3
MGQKVSPIGLRVGIIRDWESRWYAEKEFGTLLVEDIKVREFLEKKLKNAFVSRIEIERTKDTLNLIIRSGRPGAVMGQEGANIKVLIDALTKMTKKKVNVKVLQVANPNLDATLVAQKIASELEARKSFRTVQKRAIIDAMKSGAKGIKTLVSGRLGGADIARSEGYAEGVVPLHTLRSDIDYSHAEAMTTYGKLGVKVWICRGEVLPGQMVVEPEAPKEAPRGDRRGRDNNRRNDRQRPVAREEKREAVKVAPDAVVEGGK